MKTFLLIDDHPIVRFSYKNILVQSELFSDSLFYEASNINEAKEIIDKYFIDIAIVDLNLNNESGVEVIQYLQKVQKNCKIIVISFYQNIQIAYILKSLKVNAYVPKSIDINNIEQICKQVLQTNNFIAPQEYQYDLEMFDDKDLLLFLNNIKELTITEKQVLRLKVKNIKNIDIANFLGIKIKTVENYINKISVLCIPASYTFKEFIEKYKNILQFFI